MSIERLQTTPLERYRREEGLAVLEYIRKFQERRARALSAMHLSIGGTVLSGSYNILNPLFAEGVQLDVNTRLHEIGGIDTTVGMGKLHIPVCLTEWRGPNLTDPNQHDWLGKQDEPVPQAGIVALNFEQLRLEVVESLQLGPAM